MALRFVLALALGLAALTLRPAEATAGAWPREEGGIFVNATSRFAWPQDLSTLTSAAPVSEYHSIYVEYGLSRDWTLGIDLGRSVSGADKAIAFLQYPVRRGGTGMQASVQLGFGELQGQATIRPGLMLGWGLDRGWIAIDAVAEVALDSGRTDFKIDGTWGRRLASGNTVILQVHTGDTVNDPPFVRLEPSIVVPLNARIKLETGGSWGLYGDSSMGLKIGVWAEF